MVTVAVLYVGLVSPHRPDKQALQAAKKEYDQYIIPCVACVFVHMGMCSSSAVVTRQTDAAGCRLQHSS